MSPTVIPNEKVGIVIVHCGGEKVLEECIQTLDNQSRREFQIWVVDNGSRDGSAEKVAERHRGVQVLRLKKNLGWSGGNNIGIRAALADGADWVWLLNNDTMANQDCLERLMDYAQTHPGVQVLSPMVKYANPPDKVWFQGGKVDSRRLEVECCESIDEFSRLGGEKWPYISGCAMFVHRDVFRQIGLIDERYFLYCEDVDFSVRAWRAGIGLAVVPDAGLRHLVSYSTGGDDAQNPDRLYHSILSSMRFWRKFLGMREFHLRSCPVYLSKRLCGEGREGLSSLEWNVYADVLWALFTMHGGGGRRAYSPEWFRRFLEQKPWVVIAVLSWNWRPLVRSARKWMKAKAGF